MRMENILKRKKNSMNTDLKTSKMKSQILLFSCLSVFLLACGQTTTSSTKASIEGVWQTNEGYVITILSDGKNENRYLYMVGAKAEQDKASLMEPKGDSLFFFNDEGRSYPVLKYTVKNDSLIIWSGNYKPTRAKRMNTQIPKRDLKSIPPDPNSFFDYSTDKYSVGSFFDLTPKGNLPFYFNRLFIEKNKIDSFSVVLAGKKMHGDSVMESKVECTLSYVLINGLTQKMTVTRPKKRIAIVWDYHYSKNEILDSITVSGHSLKFASDGWGLDEKGNRTWQKPEDIFFWNYKDGYPLSAVSYGGFANKKTLTYKYNAQHQLVEIEERWGSSTTIENTYLLEYSSVGTLKQITAVKHY